MARIGIGSSSGISQVSNDVSQRRKKKKKYKIVAILKAGQYFGEVALVLHTRRTASIRSKSCSEVCVLNKETYERTAKEYPKDAETMKNVILRKYGHLDHTKDEVRDCKSRSDELLKCAIGLRVG